MSVSTIAPRAGFVSLLVMLVLTASSCRAVAGIFKAGVWVGVVLAVVVVGILIAVISRLGR